MPSRSQQVKTTIIQFYSKPVAQVSLELFMSIGAVLFFAIFAIRPTLLTMSDLIKEIEDKRELDQQLGQKIAALSSVQTQYLAVQDRLPVLDEAIPPQPAFERSLKIIEKLASENQIVIDSMTVKEIPQPDPETVPFESKERISVPISVSVIGNYQQIRSFVQDLQDARRSFIIDTIRFAVSDERGNKTLRANITVNMQYFGVSTAQIKK